MAVKHQQKESGEENHPNWISVRQNPSEPQMGETDDSARDQGDDQGADPGKGVKLREKGSCVRSETAWESCKFQDKLGGCKKKRFLGLINPFRVNGKAHIK